MKIPKIGKLKPMSIERLRQLPSVMLSDEDKIRLLYDLVGNIQRVHRYVHAQYKWSLDRTRDVLAWDIEHPSPSRRSMRRGKRGADVEDATQEINRHFAVWEAEHGSEV